MTAIEWTDVTWNPVAGCQRCAPGCLNCYAEVVTDKLGQHPNEKVAAKYRGLTVIRNGRPAFTGEARPWPKNLDKPLRWRKPRSVFVNSMSDLFHEGVPFEYIAAVFAVMAATQDRHKYVVLTKRPHLAIEWFEWFSRMRDHMFGLYPSDTTAWVEGEVLRRAFGRAVQEPQIAVKVGDPLYVSRWPLPNVAIGVSVSDQASADEFMPLLAQIPTVAPIVSVEPMLGPVDLSRWLACPNPACENGEEDLGGVHSWGEGITQACETCQGGQESMQWLAQVIIGAESGPGARPCQIQCARDLAKQVLDAQTRGREPQHNDMDGWHTAGPIRVISGPSLFAKQWPVCHQCHGEADHGMGVMDCPACKGTGQSRDRMTRKRKADSTPRLWVPGHGVGPWTQGIRWPS